VGGGGDPVVQMGQIKITRNLTRELQKEIISGN
jgi:hypothetical protein